MRLPEVPLGRRDRRLPLGPLAPYLPRLRPGPEIQAPRWDRLDPPLRGPLGPSFRPNRLDPVTGRTSDSRGSSLTLEINPSCPAHISRVSLRTPDSPLPLRPSRSHGPDRTNVTGWTKGSIWSGWSLCSPGPLVAVLPGGSCWTHQVDVDSACARGAPLRSSCLPCRT